MRLQSLSDALNPISPLANLSLSNSHRVLIVGCAYGGISAAVNLLDLEKGKARQSVYPGPDFSGRRSRNGIEITVIDERDGYCMSLLSSPLILASQQPRTNALPVHSVGAPLAHVTPKHTTKMWKRFSHLNELRQPNLHFKHGSVKKVDPATKIAEWKDRSGKIQQQAYDYLIMATGLKRHWPAVPKSGSYEEYLNDGEAFISKIVGGDPKNPQEGRRVVVIGAGAVGVEFAGEIKNHYPEIKVTLIHSRNHVLSSEPLPDEVKDKVRDILVEEGVDVILGNRASITEMPTGEFEIGLADGRKLTADFVIDSTKKGTPTTEVLPESCLNENKEIVVNPNLAFKSSIPNAGSHFGVGDVIAWSGIKRAGSAMVMGQAAAQNVFASILNAESGDTETCAYTELPSWPAVIGIAVGKQCLIYDKENGMKWGIEVMEGYFQDDLGWARNLQYMQLTDVVEKQEALEPEGVKMGDVGVETVRAAA